jgi:hypothetical protein
MIRLLEEHFATEDAHMTAYPYAGAAARSANSSPRCRFPVVRSNLWVEPPAIRME